MIKLLLEYKYIKAWKRNLLGKEVIQKLLDEVQRLLDGIGTFL